MLLLLLFGCAVANCCRRKAIQKWYFMAIYLFYGPSMHSIQFNSWLSILFLLDCVRAVRASCLHQLYICLCIYSISLTEWIPWSDSTCEPNQTKPNKQTNERPNERIDERKITAQRPQQLKTMVQFTSHFIIYFDFFCVVAIAIAVVVFPYLLLFIRLPTKQHVFY